MSDPGADGVPGGFVGGEPAADTAGSPPVQAETVGAETADEARSDEAGPDAHDDASSEPVDDRRRYPSTIGGAFYIAILGTTIAALVIVGSGHWRAGIRWLSAALLAAMVLRLILPERDAGMLAVRNRWLDAAVLAVLGAALWLLAATIPVTP
jgi:hypothetical protein